MSRSNWYRPSDAAKLLGCGVGKLRDCRKNGAFKYGTEYQDRSNPHNLRSCFYYNVEAIAQLWNKEPCKR
jgi:hypothetical protein